MADEVKTLDFDLLEGLLEAKHELERAEEEFQAASDADLDTRREAGRSVEEADEAVREAKEKLDAARKKVEKKVEQYEASLDRR